MTARTMTSEYMGAVAEPVAEGTSTLHRVWFAALQKPWHCLAVIPADVTDGSGRIARALTDIAHSHGERRISYVDARGAHLTDVHDYVSLIKMADERSSLVVVLDPLMDNPAATPIARAASGVLVVVRRGKSRLAAARSTIQTIGHDRLLGIVAID